MRFAIFFDTIDAELRVDICRDGARYCPSGIHQPVHGSDPVATRNALQRQSPYLNVIVTSLLLIRACSLSWKTITRPRRSSCCKSLTRTSRKTFRPKIRLQVITVVHAYYSDPHWLQAFRAMVVEMVLSTDMARHFKFVGDFKSMIDKYRIAADSLLIHDYACFLFMFCILLRLCQRFLIHALQTTSGTS